MLGSIGLGLLFLLPVFLLSACQVRSPEGGRGSQTVDTVAVEDDAPDPAMLITPEGIGVAQLGLTFEVLKQRLEAEFGTPIEYRPQLGFMPDWDAIAVVQSGQLLYYLLYPAGTALNDTDPIDHLVTENPRFQTREGIGPGMTVQAVTEHYGTVRSPVHSTASTAASSKSGLPVGDPEHGGLLRIVEFEQQPDALVLRIPREGAALTDARIVSVELRQPTVSSLLSGDSGKAPATVQGLAESNSAGPGVVLPASLPPVNPSSLAPSGSRGLPSSSEASSAMVSEHICQNPNSQKTLSQCARQTLERSETLQQQLQSQSEQQFPQLHAALLKAQTSWRDHRQADCDYTYRHRADMAAYTTLVTACQTALTEVRIGELRSVLMSLAPESTPSHSVSSSAPISTDTSAKSENSTVGSTVKSFATVIGENRAIAPDSIPSASLSETPSFNLTLDCSVAQSDLTFSACTQANFQSADRALQVQTQQLTETLSPDDQAQLQALQQIWGIFRRDHCAWRGQLQAKAKQPGSQQPGSQKPESQKPESQQLDAQQRYLGYLNQCLTQQTEKRQSTLATWLLEASETLPTQPSP